VGIDFKFIHCADLHLGSRFQGVSQKDPELGKRLAESTFSSFDRIVDLAIKEGADFMVISGDSFDESTETPRTKFRFTEALKRSGIPCFIVRGNHDFKMSWEDSIPYPDNVRIFSPEGERIPLDIHGKRMEVIGRSFPKQHTSENIAASLTGTPGIFTVAVAHCSLDAVTEDLEYAPCKLSDLRNRNVDYWALGHIHKRCEVCTDPYVVYAGNIQGRNPKETGEKGAYVVSVENGRISELRFVATQEILWQYVNVDIAGKDMGGLMDDLRSKTKKGAMVVLRLSGRGYLDTPLRLDPEDLKAQASRSSGCTITDLVMDTAPALDLEDLRNGSGLISEIAKASEKYAKMDRTGLIDAMCTTKPSEDIRYAFEQLDEPALRSLVKDAEMLMIEKLSEVTR
jgi:DNA repair protein SbcD/Mre11